MILDAQEAQSASPEVDHYTTSTQGLAVTSKISSGFALLARAEASELMPHSSDNPYRTFRTLLEACRMNIVADGMPRMQATVERLGLFAVAPEAKMRVQGS